MSAVFVRKTPNGVTVENHVEFRLVPLNGRNPEITLARGMEIAEKKLYGLAWWVAEGTALGFARSGDFIEWDTDIDVHLCLPWDNDQTLITDLIDEMSSNGFDLARTMTYQDRITQAAFVDRTNHNLIFDYLFLYYSPGDNVCRHYSDFGVQEMPLAMLLDIVPLETKYGLHPRIQPDELYLSYRYGEEWMIPKKDRTNRVRKPM